MQPHNLLVFTDTGKELLELCQRNIDSSSGDAESCRNITVRELDWKSPFSESCGYTMAYIANILKCFFTIAAGFSWSEDDLKKYHSFWHLMVYTYTSELHMHKM